MLCVALADAKAYVAWLSSRTGKTYRLPSEAEREYATRAGTTTPFWWGATISTEQASYNGTHAYAGGAKGVAAADAARRQLPRQSLGPLQRARQRLGLDRGLLDEANAGNPGDGSARTGGDCRWRVARGGAWNPEPTYLRAAFRYWNVPHNRSSVQGFQVVRGL